MMNSRTRHEVGRNKSKNRENGCFRREPRHTKSGPLHWFGGRNEYQLIAAAQREIQTYLIGETMQELQQGASHDVQPPPLLTIRDFHSCFEGAIGINAVRAAVKQGRIRSIRVGERKRLIPRSELTEWPLRESEHTHVRSIPRRQRQ